MGPGRYLIFFLIKFPVNAVRIMSGDLFLTRVMTIFIYANILEIIYTYIYIYPHIYIYLQNGHIYKHGHNWGQK